MNTKKDSPLKFGGRGGEGVFRNRDTFSFNNARSSFGGGPREQGDGFGTGFSAFGSGVNGGGYGGASSGPNGGMFGNNPAMAAINNIGANFGGGQSRSTGASTSRGIIGGNALMGAMGSIRNGESIRNRQTNSIANVKKVAANNKRLVDKGLVAPGSKPDSRAPLFQLKNNNMEYNNINNKAFSNAGTIKNIMGESVPNTFTRKLGNSPFKQVADPNIDQMTAESIDQPIPPPNRIATATTPPYDINNY